jgi:hypothetical protein
VIANGYTGQIAGRYPKSPWKIVFAVLVVIFFLILLKLMSGK